MLRGLKKPLYSNCVILTPDGKVLCRSGERRMNWYLNKGLAEKISDDPPTIKLKFEPRGKGDSEDAYMLADKVNKCVVCGTESDLTRHHVVPYCYRVHFSDETKNHSSYDILPVCVHCHEKYEIEGQKFRKQILDELRIKEDGGVRVDTETSKAIKAANAIKRHGDVIPTEKLEQLYEVLREYFNKEDVTEEEIEKTAELEWKIVPEGYACASKKVVENQSDLDSFALRWRCHFIAVMNPKFLPAQWTLNRKIYNE